MNIPPQDALAEIVGALMMNNGTTTVLLSNGSSVALRPLEKIVEEAMTAFLTTALNHEGKLRTMAELLEVMKTTDTTETDALQVHEEEPALSTLLSVPVRSASGTLLAHLITPCGAAACPNLPHRHVVDVRLASGAQIPETTLRFVCSLIDAHPGRPDVWRGHIALLNQCHNNMPSLMANIFADWMGKGLVHVHAGGDILLWPTEKADSMSILPTHGPGVAVRPGDIEFVPNHGRNLRVMLSAACVQRNTRKKGVRQ